MRAAALVSCAIALLGCGQPASQSEPVPAPAPAARPTGSPDERAAALVQRLTPAEKLQLVHGVAWCNLANLAEPGAERTRRGAGFVAGIARLGIPDLNYTDGPAGVVNCGERRDAQSTSLPAPIALAATWDPQLASDFGALIGREARAQGFAVALNGAVNLVREPRGGRTFEYLGEDPLLAGTLVARELRGTQDQHVVATLKHFVGNEQESGRSTRSSQIDDRTLRELYLWPFEIAVADSGVGSVMCAYNKLNNIPACEHRALLTRTLEQEWGFRGWVVSDWDALHSTVESANAGVDDEETTTGVPVFYNHRLTEAIAGGAVPAARLDDMVRRKLRTLIDVGVFDDPPGAGTVDVAAGQAVAQRVEEAAIVLLANRNQQLPLNATALHAIAVIGGHADVAVATGGGSSQVATRQDSPVVEPCAAELELYNGACRTWLRSSPLAAIRAHAPGATISYQDGHDPEAAAASAAKADVAIVFATTWMHESKDLADLALPDAQDELIGRVAEANPHTIVVLETGTAVTMPWLANVSAVVEAWYPGIRGADAIARVLFGDVDPSGRLPITFPRAEADLPSPAAPVDADVNYAERLLIGYRWFDARAKEPLFPFGFGLSYTHVATSNLTAQLARTGGHVELDVANIGARPGAEVVPVYLQFPAAADEPPRRLVAWQKVALAHGETRHVSIDVPARELRVWTEHGWTVLPGDYAIIVGTLHVTTRI